MAREIEKQTLIELHNKKLHLEKVKAKATRERMKQLQAIKEAEEELNDYATYLILSKSNTQIDVRAELGISDFLMREIVKNANNRNVAKMKGENV